VSQRYLIGVLEIFDRCPGDIRKGVLEIFDECPRDINSESWRYLICVLEFFDGVQEISDRCPRDI